MQIVRQEQLQVVKRGESASGQRTSRTSDGGKDQRILIAVLRARLLEDVHETVARFASSRLQGLSQRVVRACDTDPPYRYFLVNSRAFERIYDCAGGFERTFRVIPRTRNDQVPFFELRQVDPFAKRDRDLRAAERFHDQGTGVQI